MLTHQIKYMHNWKEFEEIFGVPLSWFHSIFTGLTITSFDGWLETPDGVSTEEFVKNKFGDRAVELVRELL